MPDATMRLAVMNHQGQVIDRLRRPLAIAADLASIEGDVDRIQGALASVGAGDWYETGPGEVEPDLAQLFLNSLL